MDLFHFGGLLRILIVTTTIGAAVGVAALAGWRRERRAARLARRTIADLTRVNARSAVRRSVKLRLSDHAI